MQSPLDYRQPKRAYQRRNLQDLWGKPRVSELHDGDGMGRWRGSAPPRQAGSPLDDTAEAEVRRRIAERGRVTFAEFSELALYNPAGGYYTGESHNDYFTSPEVHPAFGALLARLAHRVWNLLERPSRFDVVELGSGGGQLAQDFTSYASGLCPSFGSKVNYLAIDRAGSGRQTARRDFEQLIASGVPLRHVNGFVMSNELVDSFPVHRFEIRDGAVHEVYVTLAGDELVEELGEPSTPLIEERLASIDGLLFDGLRGELNLGIRPLMKQVAGALASGVVLTIDYGHEARELYSPVRKTGTLQTYRRHLFGSEPYCNIGKQDITAHVDFSALEDEGSAAGFRTLGLTTQENALEALGLGGVFRQSGWAALPPSMRARNRLAVEELVQPDGLGGFKWLFQAKGLDIRDVAELFAAPLECRGCASDPVLPLALHDRVRLGESKSVGATFELEELWPSEW